MGVSNYISGAPTGSSWSQKSSAQTQDGELPPVPIAIVGMASKFSGEASSSSKLWDVCAAGKDGWSRIPADRFNVESLYHPEKEKFGRNHVTGGYFIKEDIRNFDAPFFSLSAEVANAMDPQLRLMLESVYEAVEDAGIPIENLAGSDTSVFSGCFGKDYAEMLLRDPELLPNSFMTGNGTAMLSNRVSHFYDLKGPSMTIDTGCSTGLVALHQAVQSLRAGESKISITGAACVILNPDLFIGLSGQGVLGAGGRCYAWDDRAEGYGRGEGIATLVLKRLDDAIQDGDNIQAIIRETALNQDGKTATITSPSMQAQQELIERCYRQAGLSLAETGYVEAHMTGTPTGDPIEAEAIARTFGKSRARYDPVIVGGVKTNIGHTEPVSGLASIIKCVYALKNKQIPPNLNYHRTNPNIPLKEWNLQVPTALMPWPENKPLRASINNFGYGGTNAHVILEAYNATSGNEGRLDNGLTNGHNESHTNGHANGIKASHVKDPVNGHTNGQPNGLKNGHSNGVKALHTNGYSNGVANGHPHDLKNGAQANTNGHVGHDSRTPDENSRVFVVSSKASETTQAISMQIASHVRESLATGRPSFSFDDLAYTLGERRSRMPWATAVRARSLPEVAEKLGSSDRKPTKSNRKPRIGYVFNGQGGQWHAMGRELMQAYPVYNYAIHVADRVLKAYGAEWSLVEELMRDEKSSRVHEINISQPSTVALQLCLVDLLSSWGIEPAAVTSHSSGEIAAAYAVGALSFSEALGVVYYRGAYALKHQQASLSRYGKGGMLAAGLGPERAKEYIARVTTGRVVVACVNSPDSVTISGDMPALDELVSILAKDDIFARKVKVPLAYHSHHMEAMAEDYLTSLKAILPETRHASWTGATFASPVTGGILKSVKDLDAQHWVTNLTSPVLFSTAFEGMCFESPSSDKLNVDLIVEIGAHSTMSGPIRQILKKRSLPYASCLKRGADAVETMQDLACDLVSRGSPVALDLVNSAGRQGSPKYVHGLPSYAWNHEKQYWTEPRRYKEYRDTHSLPHELLGVPVPGANPTTLLWRNFLRTSDIPWLADHQLDSKIVLPGAGYISMAIEAVRLVTDASEASINGYRLRDIDIRNALTVPDTAAGVEVQLCLRPCSENELDHKGWYEFEVTSGGSSTQDAWVINCRGFVSAETNNTALPAPSSEQLLTADKFIAPDQKSSVFDPEQIWADGRKMSLYHGPLFRNLDTCRTAGPKIVTDFRVGGIVTELERYVLHPTTLDSIIQTLFAGLADETKKDAMVVPRSIGSLFVPSGLKRLAGDKLQAFTDIGKSDRRGALADIDVVNNDKATTAAVLRLKDLYCQSVPRDEGSNPDEQDLRMCSKAKWELDVLHSVPSTVRDRMRIHLDEQEADFEKRLLRVSYNYISDTLTKLQGMDLTSLPWHLKIFYGWMKTVDEQGRAGQLAKGSDRWWKTNVGLKQSLADTLAAENAAGRLTCRVGQNLEAIFRLEVVPIEMMLEDGLLNQYYADIPRLKSRAYKHLHEVLEMYAIKQPAAKVLEIGAGTGGATSVALEAFAARGRGGNGTLVGSYHYSDVSAGFFEPAKEKFAAWTSVMDFKVLDIGSDPTAQSFTAGSYDLIIASQVLHATPDLKKTLSHVRSLLKPNGKLVLVETTQDRLDTQLIFGTLAGWWLSEEPERKFSPNAPLPFWDDKLKAAGFTGVDFEIGDCEELDFQSISIIVTTAKSQPTYPASISIVHDVVAPPQKWLQELTGAIRKATLVSPAIETLAQVEPQENVTYIVIAEMAEPLVSRLDAAKFEQLRRLLVRSRGILWVGSGGHIDAIDPAYATTQGLLRTLKQEDGKRVVQLDLEPRSQPWVAEHIGHITHVLRQSFDENTELDDIEWEYATKDSTLYVPRFYPDNAQDKASSTVEVDPEPERQHFWQADRPLVWETRKSGLLSNLYFTDKPELELLPAGKIEIEPKAFGLNFRDVLVGLGQLDETFIGHECAGVVTRLGADTEASGLKVGDRVCGVMTGRFGNIVHAYWTGVTKIPDTISWEEAASIPLIYSTSWIALFDIARVEKGERVLIHAGTGGVGQSAIMLAQWAGAEVFATCGTPSKRQFLRERYGIPDDHIFSSRDMSFGPAIMKATGGLGVDVVVNSLAGPLLKTTWECIAEFGRFVEIGKVDIEAARRLDMSPFGRCGLIAGLDLLYYNEHRGSVLNNAIRQCVKLCEQGYVRPVYPITPYSITDMEHAMRMMQKGTHMGKLVIVPGPQDDVNVVSRQRALDLGSSQGTYMVVGGLGGIGKSIAEWLVEKGAEDVLLVSRSAASHPDAGALIQSASEKGCNLVVKSCDIGNENKLKALLSDLAGSMPPVRGVIQAAMVLDDAVLERITYDQWCRGSQPKVDGTLNLHNNLPDLDFFVMLSSLTGVAGNTSQASYAAGNTFQDALARHRTTKGQPAVSLDLGAVADVGFVAESGNEVQDRIEKKLGSIVLPIGRVLGLLEAAIRDPLRRSLDDAQVITCIGQYDRILPGTAVKRDKRFATMQLANGASALGNVAGQEADKNSLSDLFVSQVSDQEVSSRIAAALVSKLSDLFNIAVSDIDGTMPMSHYGVDSLIAVELRNWLKGAARARVTIFEILQSASLLEFAFLVAGRAGLLGNVAAIEAKA